jgi:hypothetical protein
MNEVLHAVKGEARLRLAVALPQILDAGFDVFEFVRIIACQDQVPGCSHVRDDRRCRRRRVSTRSTVGSAILGVWGRACSTHGPGSPDYGVTVRRAYLPHHQRSRLTCCPVLQPRDPAGASPV